MSKMLPPSHRVAVVGAIDPDAAAAATYTTAWVDMAYFQSLMAVLSVGEIAAGGTVDAKMEQAKDAAGLDAKDIDNAAITQLTQAGGDSDKQAVINCYADDMDIKEGEFTHARLSVTVAGASADMAATLLGFDPRFDPASKFDAASVAEIVNPVDA